MQVVLKPMGVLMLSLVTIALCVCIFLRAHRQSDLPTDTVAPTQHLVGQWSFDEGTGTVAGDSSAGKHPGTLQGNAGWTAGLVGTHALNLPAGNGSFVDIPQTVVDTAKSFTVTACVRLHRPGVFQTIVSIDGDKVSGFYLQLRDPGATFGFAFLPADDPARNQPVIASMQGAPTLDQWYHLAGVYDATAHTISLYVNGTLAQTAPLASSWHASGHTLIGRGLYDKNPTDFVEGQIDDVRFYDIPLPADQVKSIADTDLLPAALRTAPTAVVAASPTPH